MYIRANCYWGRSLRKAGWFTSSHFTNLSIDSMDAHRASEDITGSPISQLSGITVVSDTPTTVHVHTRLSTVSEEHPTPETTVHEQGQASQDEGDVPWEKPDWKHPSKDDLLSTNSPFLFVTLHHL